MTEILNVIGTGGAAAAVIYVVTLFLKDRKERDDKFSEIYKSLQEKNELSVNNMRADVKEIMAQYIDIMEKTVEVCRDVVLAVKEVKDKMDVEK